MPKRTPPTATARNKAGEGILDIPNLGILLSANPETLIHAFEEKWKARPKGVILPVVHPDGLLFSVDGLSVNKSQFAEISSTIRDFEDVVAQFSDMGLDIYLLIDPSMPFLHVGALHIVDISGNSSPHHCFFNPRSRDIIVSILMTAIDLTIEITRMKAGKLVGIVLDLVDLWGMGADNQRIKLTCFCPSCTDYFEQTSPNLIRSFKTFPNPWNLLLKGSRTGISQISDIHPTTSDSDIIGLSRNKGLYDVFQKEDPLIVKDMARTVLRYIQTRHNQTLSAIDDIMFRSLEGLDTLPRRIILTEGSYYDWTSGLQLEALDVKSDEKTLKPYDEVWFDPSSTDLILRSVPFRSYLWTRARYFIDAFFQMCGRVTDSVTLAQTGLGSLSQEQLRSLCRQRLDKALGATMDEEASLLALPPSISETTDSQRAGFIAIALTREYGERIVESLRIPALARDTSREIIKPIDLMELLGRMGGLNNSDDDE